MPCPTASWSPNGTTVAGGHGVGNGTNQFNTPYGLFVDANNVLFVADHNQDRVMKWEQGASAGSVVAGGQGLGFGNGQLSFPRGLTVDRDGSLFITDGSPARLTRWIQGAEKGEALISVNYAYFSDIVLDMKEEFFYVADRIGNRVLKYAKNGTDGQLVAGGNGYGEALNQFNRSKSKFV